MPQQYRRCSETDGLGLLAAQVLLSMRAHNPASDIDKEKVCSEHLSGGDDTPPEVSPKKRKIDVDGSIGTTTPKRPRDSSGASPRPQRVLPGARAKSKAMYEATPQAPSRPLSATNKPSCPAEFSIVGTQGQLAVCDRKAVVLDDIPRSYFLVRLRGQSNTLPHDASLHVQFRQASATPQTSIKVHFARVRIKAGCLHYDFLPDPVELGRIGGSNSSAYSSPLLASIFSKKCWSGVVVRGPRMFVAFIAGSPGCQSLPMFVEISPTANSPGYRDPVTEYPDDLLHQFFRPSTIADLRKMHTSSRRLTF